MGIDAAYQLCLEAGLGQVRIVNYQTLKGPFRVAPRTGPPQKAQGHPIDQLAILSDLWIGNRKGYEYVHSDEYLSYPDYLAHYTSKTKDIHPTFYV